MLFWGRVSQFHASNTQVGLKKGIVSELGIRDQGQTTVGLILARERGRPLPFD